MGIPELQGAAKGGEVVALVIHALLLTAMQETKIVWRATCHGPLACEGHKRGGQRRTVVRRSGSGPIRDLACENRPILSLS